MIEVLVGAAGLILGFILGWVICNARHASMRGTIAAKTIQACKDLIVGAMESPEFHAAIMNVVHPGCEPTQGFNFQAQLPSELPESLSMPMSRRKRSRK